MSIIEQVEKLKKDMEQLLEDVYGTDSENIDFEQLKQLSNYSKGYSLEVNEFINNRLERF